MSNLIGLYSRYHTCDNFLRGFWSVYNVFPAISTNLLSHRNKRDLCALCSNIDITKEGLSNING